MFDDTVGARTEKGKSSTTQTRLEPLEGDFIVPKGRYSGFCGTDLDGILRSRGIRHLLFVGIASNVCVESTLREAYHREYFCVFVRDATQASGPAFMQDAVIYSVETFLGWTTTTQDLCAALACSALPPKPSLFPTEPTHHPQSEQLR